LDGYNLTEIILEIEKYVASTSSNPCEVLRILWETNGATTFQKRRIGSTNPVSEAEILQLILCKLQSFSGEEYLPQKGKETEKEKMRSMWLREAFTGTSHRSRLQEQFARKHSDSLQGLSRLLAQIGYKAWLEYRRSHASNRVNRLKGLGNAIVPQIAFEIFKAIDTIETT
jgi:hypothetical protein